MTFVAFMTCRLKFGLSSRIGVAARPTNSQSFRFAMPKYDPPVTKRRLLNSIVSERSSLLPQRFLRDLHAFRRRSMPRCRACFLSGFVAFLFCFSPSPPLAIRASTHAELAARPAAEFLFLFRLANLRSFQRAPVSSSRRSSHWRFITPSRVTPLLAVLRDFSSAVATIARKPSPREPFRAFRTARGRDGRKFPTAGDAGNPSQQSLPRVFSRIRPL